MRRNWTPLLLTLAATVCVTVPARTASRGQPDASAAVIAEHPMLRSSLGRISAGSRLWREALAVIEGTGRRAIVLTPEQVAVRDRQDGASLEPFDPGVLAEASPVVVSGSQVPVVLVVVNVPLLQRLHHSQRWSSPLDVHRDLDRIVIHEVYGHAFPYLLAGDVSGRCPDAVPGQVAAEACAIRRENAVRAELRLGLRQDAGLNGLSLTRHALGLVQGTYSSR